MNEESKTWIIGLWTDKERRLDTFVKWLRTKIVRSVDELASSQN